MNTIGKNISILSRQFNAFLSHELKGKNITATELMYLASLYKKDSITQDDLVKEFCIDKAATARTIQKMEDKGLVIRKIDLEDKRAKKIYLTKKADSYKTLIGHIQKKWIQEINMDLSNEDIEAFERILEIITQKTKKLNNL